MTAADRWVVREKGGAVYMRSAEPLGAYPVSLAERLVHWAREAPERTFLARRGPDGAWIRLTYGDALPKARAIGAAVLRRGLCADRPVAILAGNGLEHGLMSLGCLYAGVPWCPISPAYSQSAGDLAKLRHVLELVTPGLVFVDDTAAFARALDLAGDDAEIVAAQAGDGRAATSFSALSAGEGLVPADLAAADAAFAAIGPDSIAKFLLTSGSTGAPKAVINTQRMLCANQRMILETIPALAARPPVIVDWLPWNHTFGGNKIFGLTLFHGGTLYIDDGRPVRGRFDATLRTLREISPTAYFNVPAGFEMLLPHLESDADLRRRLFADCALMFYAGAGLARDTMLRLEAVAAEASARPRPPPAPCGFLRSSSRPPTWACRCRGSSSSWRRWATRSKRACAGPASRQAIGAARS
jgi:feruloyl-CoA synthase